MKRIGKYEKKPEPKAQKKKTANPLLQTYLTSLLCMVLCVTMFLSTTMAWFTDEVGSHGNQIYVGNLSMRLTWNNGVESVNLASAENANTPIFGDSVVWTPGHMEARELTLTKDGNMDFSYRLDAQILKDGQPIPNKGAEYALAEYFLVYCKKEALPESLTIGEVQNQENGWTYSGTLAEVLQEKEFCRGTMTKDEQPQKISIVIYLKPEIPSTYIYAKLENIYIFMTAYQTAGTVTVTPVNNAVDLAAALQADGIVVLSSDITLPADTTLEIPADKTVTLNLNGKKLTGGGSTVLDVKGDLTLEGGTIENAGQIACVEGGGKLTVNGGIFNATNPSQAEYIACAIYQPKNGTLTVNGGTFNIKDGVGILLRDGTLTMADGVIFNHTSVVDLDKGKVGDADTEIEVGNDIVTENHLSGYGVPSVTLPGGHTYRWMEYNNSTQTN